MFWIITISEIILFAALLFGLISGAVYNFRIKLELVTNRILFICLAIFVFCVGVIEISSNFEERRVSKQPAHKAVYFRVMTGPDSYDSIIGIQ